MDGKGGARLLSLRHISKTYKKDSITALDGDSFDVKRGELVGILGPNGAGKTTLVKIVSDLMGLSWQDSQFPAYWWRNRI